MPDLDTAFFNGRLRTHVLVAWEDGFTILFAFNPDANSHKNLGFASFDSVNKISYIHCNKNRELSSRTRPKSGNVANVDP